MDGQAGLPAVRCPTCDGIFPWSHQRKCPLCQNWISWHEIGSQLKGGIRESRDLPPVRQASQRLDDGSS